MNKEQWKVCGEFPAYEVSNLGRVRNGATGKVKKQSRRGGNHGGPTADYLCAKFCRDGRQYVRDIHRLVAIAFCPQPDWIATVQVNHKDGNKANPAARNLEWVTPQENADHAQRTGLLQRYRMAA